MTSNKYWRQRNVIERERLLNNISNLTEEEIARRYLATSKRVINEIKDLYDDIMSSDNPQVSDLYKYNKYYEMLNSLNHEMEILGGEELELFSDKFEQLYELNSKLIGQQLGISTSVQPELAKRTIRSIWTSDGQLWSDRIWTSKRAMIETLKSGLVDCITTGATREQLTKTLMDRFNVGFYNANRLARTEMSHIYNQSAIDKYHEAGVSKVRILVEDDACDECQEYDDKVYEIDEAPIIPVHPNCRCCYLAVIEE